MTLFICICQNSHLNIFFSLQKSQTNPETVLWFEPQFDYNNSFRFEIWYDSKANLNMSPKSLYEPWLRCMFSAEIQHYINFIWLRLLQVFPTTLLRNVSFSSFEELVQDTLSVDLLVIIRQLLEAPAETQSSLCTTTT